MKNIFISRTQLEPAIPNPTPLKVYRKEEDEDGIPRLVECNLVPDVPAEQFSVTENSLLNREGSASYRISSDPVDVEERLSKLID